MKNKLQYISQGISLDEQERNIQEALDHGAGWIQVRWKNAPEKELVILCENARLWCTGHGATCIINDHIHLAKEVDADGVHLGLKDEAIQKAFDVLGKGKIIGGTANTLEDVIQRTAEQCDYIGMGPFRFTSTKSNLSPVLGIKGYTAIMQQLRNLDIAVPPIYAIGGIEYNDIALLMNTGISGIAVSGMITKKPDLISNIMHQLKENE